MNENKGSRNIVGVLLVIFAVVFGLVYLGISATKNIGKTKAVISVENAVKKLDRLYSDISVSTVAPRKEQISIAPSAVKDALPEIDKYPPQVDNATQAFVEIFSSTEKAGTGKDGWLVDVAKKFNASGQQVDGRTVSVRIRGIASGMGTDYIVSGKYIPDAFSPSNELWGEIIRANGLAVKLVDRRLTGNVPGILLTKAKMDEISKKYGSVNAETVVDAVVNNELALGYTNPFASSTGLNLLVSVLDRFDKANLLSDNAITGFQKFQANIPFVAYTTLQMRDSAKSGVLDGFVMEYQTYANEPSLRTDYVFTPFGYRHDSPLYALGELSAVKTEILDMFNEFCKSGASQQLATDYGFNNLDDYQPMVKSIDGSAVEQAQKLWKEKKNAARETIAVFVADTSGSMEGESMNSLKKSLLNGAQYISKENSIGLVTFSNDVQICLPIGKFDISQRSFFAGAVTDMQANGGTAMYDSIIVASKMLMEQRALHPDAALMLFVLTDGDSNQGHEMKDVEDVMRALKIPIYTIGYNANIKVLQALSSINEAAGINADSEDVVYKLAQLFNAQM
jgi:Ca-activated chloride channel family protein